MEISPKNDDQRLQLMDELYQRYGGDSGLTTLSNRVRFWRKKYAWSIVVSGAKMLKRIIDILAAGLMLIALSPLFLGWKMGTRVSIPQVQINGRRCGTAQRIYFGSESP
jgi:lipopolysaccharide/colanic/teichoic acid biosynthesis glycosyltransferase